MVSALVKQRNQNTNGNSNSLLESAPSVAAADAILAQFGYVEAPQAVVV